ncbi:MAG: DUF423 domain-containing protein [Planctomycetota bacterium]
MLQAAALLGAAAVLLGAFAAHGLEGRISDQALRWFQTGAHYHGWHALALFGCGLLGRTGRTPRAAAWAFVAGIALFSGSLYAMALTDARWLGAVTPLGGTAFVVGWLLLLPCCRAPRTAVSG